MFKKLLCYFLGHDKWAVCIQHYKEHNVLSATATFKCVRCGDHWTQKFQHAGQLTVQQLNWKPSKVKTVEESKDEVYIKVKTK